MCIYMCIYIYVCFSNLVHLQLYNTMVHMSRNVTSHLWFKLKA